GGAGGWGGGGGVKRGGGGGKGLTPAAAARGPAPRGAPAGIVGGDMPLPSRRRCVWTASAVAALSLAGLLIYASTREALYDPSFDARVDPPAYAGARPPVLFDEAHRNPHTAGGGYPPLPA